MLSVIHPSSTQQHHIGAFRSSNSYHNEAFGFHHPASSSSSSMSTSHAAGKWVPTTGSHHPQWPTSSATSAYLFRHHPQYTNSGSTAAAFTAGVSSSFKFYNYASSRSRSNPRVNSTSSSSSSRSSENSSSSSNNRSSSNNLLQQPVAKDYSKPLFVDCSIEYELPNAPKIPKNSEPILMIHPAYNKQPSSRSVKRASSSSLNKSSSSQSSGRGVSNMKSKGVKRTHSQLSSDVIMSNQVALLQHQGGLQFSSRHQSSCCSTPHYGQTPPPAKRCCPGLLLNQEQIKQHQEFRQHQQVQQHQQQYYWQQTMNNSRCNNNANSCTSSSSNNNTYSHLPPHQQPTNNTDYCCWLPTPTSSAAALAYYKAQIRMRQQESFLKSISQGAATTQSSTSFCLDCVQGKCSQVAWNKENLGFMRSL